MKKFIHWIPPIVCMGIIFWLSASPRFTATGQENTDFFIFKTLHAIGYSYLALLMFNAVFKTITQHIKKAIGLAGILSILYAATDEIHQAYIFSRSGTPRDILFDSIGVIIILLLLYFKWPTLKKLF